MPRATGPIHYIEHQSPMKDETLWALADSDYHAREVLSGYCECPFPKMTC